MTDVFNSFMASFLGFLLASLVAFIAGTVIGGSMATDSITEKCKRQGSFYVGKEDFRCEVKK